MSRLVARHREEIRMRPIRDTRSLPRKDGPRFNERFELSLSTPQRDALEVYGEKHALSTNAVIRRAIDRLLAEDAAEGEGK